MVTQESIDLLMRQLSDTFPAQLFRSIDRTQMGIGAVFCCICEAGHPVTAGEISAYMNVSTARVAVLLHKMLDKDLLVRQTDPNDARRVLVSLSDQGRATIEEFHTAINAMLGAIIDRIGFDRMEEYVSISQSIKDVIEEIMENHPEENKCCPD